MEFNKVVLISLTITIMIFLLFNQIKRKIAVKKVMNILCKEYYILEKATLEKELSKIGYNEEEIRDIELLINHLSVK